MTASAYCGLCPHQCAFPGGARGLCRVRAAGGGNGADGAGSADALYGLVTALALDPIEKKPLYHWRPGSRILSAGFAGCNMHCPFCQNWHISQTGDVSGRRFSPEELAGEAAGAGCGQLAYTYSEPLVHVEFLLDCMTAAREAGIANVLVTNGCINEPFAAQVLALTDAANVDLKCFSPENYAKVLGGDLETVQGFIRAAVSLGVHIEVTTLAVPGFNDNEAELDGIAAFIAGLGSGTEDPCVPWHISAYHPEWKWNAPPSDPSFLAAAVRRARKALPYVYAGNAAAPAEFQNTFCPHCQAALVRRNGYSVDTDGLRYVEGEARYRCAKCGKPVPVRR
jgi:pyruvate formate lyase activating enzyme